MHKNDSNIKNDSNLVMSDTHFITIIQKCATLMREVESRPLVYSYNEFLRAWEKYEYLINFPKDQKKNKFIRQISPMLYYQAYTFISEMDMAVAAEHKNNSYLSN